MLEHVKAARKSMKDKLDRYMSDRAGPVSADGMTERVLDAEAKTGPRPISRRAYKRGGKVAVAAEGKGAKHNAGRKARKAGGKAATPDSLINRDVKEANEDREGKKHVGGFKRGGKVHRKHRDLGGEIDGVSPADDGLGDDTFDAAKKRTTPAIMKPGNLDANSLLPIRQGGYNDPYERMPAPMPPVKKKLKPMGQRGYKKGGAVHPDLAEDKKLIKKAFREHENAEHGGKHEVLKLKKGGRTAKKAGGGLSLDGEIQGTRPTGGRLARKQGGRAKGKTNINIIIGAGHGAQAPMQNPAGAAPPLPMIKPVQAPPPGMAPPAGGGMPPMSPPPGAGAPPPGMPPMPRKRGGRTIKKGDYC